jgi:hypothetical protein
VLRLAGVPQRGFWWFLGWILSALLVVPLAIFTTYAFSLPFMAVLNLGTHLNWWPALDSAAWLMLGFTAGLGIFTAWAQWLLLRRFLPGASRWFAAAGSRDPPAGCANPANPAGNPLVSPTCSHWYDTRNRSCRLFCRRVD